MGNKRTVSEQTFAYKSMSTLLRAKDSEHRFIKHKAKFMAPCQTIRCLIDHDDMEIFVRIPWLFRDMPNKARMELMEYALKRTQDVHAPLFGPYVRRFMKSELFTMRYYCAALQSGRTDMRSVPGMDIHRWWSKINKFWRYFSSEEWLKCKAKTEIRSRTWHDPKMPIITVDPVLKWVFVDPDIFYKVLDADTQEFLIFVACCVFVAYDADHDELSMSDLTSYIKRYPEWGVYVEKLEENGYRLPLGLTFKRILNNRLTGRRTGCMFNKNTRKIKTGLEFKAYNAAAAYLLFKELNGHRFEDDGESTARDRAIETYVTTMEYMDGEDGAIPIADKLGVKPDYYPWTEADTVTYTFGFELVAGDIQLGVIESMTLVSKKTILRIKTGQFTLDLPIIGLCAYVDSLADRISNVYAEDD